jgi:hypothetical protein
VGEHLLVEACEDHWDNGVWGDGGIARIRGNRYPHTYRSRKLISEFRDGVVGCQYDNTYFHHHQRTDQ